MQHLCRILRKPPTFSICKDFRRLFEQGSNFFGTPCIITEDKRLEFACVLLGGVKLIDEIECLEVLDDGHGRLLVRHEPLLQTLLVVIRPEAERG